MAVSGDDSRLLPGEDTWSTIQETMERTRDSLYLAGSASILLLWGVIASLGYLADFALAELATEFHDEHGWINGPIWGGLAVVGMLGSAVIGHRAGSRIATGEAVRHAGLRVFFFWLAIVIAAFLIPGAAGNWNSTADAEGIQRIAVGVVMLGYILFGIMLRPMIAAAGAAVAAAYYLPSYLAGDLAPLITALATLAIVFVAAVWIRRTGVL